MRKAILIAASAGTISQAIIAPPPNHASAQQAVLGNDFGVPGKNATYDYVVVGGGTAGLTIAYRLAEDGTKTVAVIEAGGFAEIENGNVSVVPAYNQEYNYITPDSQWDAPLVDWGFLTTPQAGGANQTFHYGRGKMLGGCSNQNAMNYNRATAGTMQWWADLVGDSDYTWDNFFPYYERSLNYTEPNTKLRAANATVPTVDKTNMSGGPLQVSFPNWASPMASWAQLAFRELGISDVHSLIEGELIGSQYSGLVLDPVDQSRSSSQTAFQRTAYYSRRQNLHIFTHSLAQQVLFDQNKTATGVVVKSGPSPQSFVLSAKEEVIVSAGAFQSPQLLMVSGVGPAELLQEHNITVIADRPGVGQNMWDHPVFSVGRRVEVETYGRLMNATLAEQAKQDYANGLGILTNDLADYLGWEKIPQSYRNTFSPSTLADLATFPSDWPEVEHQVASTPFGSPPFSTPEMPIDEAYLIPVLISPLSRGNISISSPSMSDPPLINPNWLTHPTDQTVSIAIFKRAREFFNTTAIAPILIGPELAPGQDLPDGSSDEAILQYLQKNIGFNWHASCTCKMGKKEDPMAVVDSKARVMGVKRLRVVDASAFAILPPGHPQATVYALAEKIAEDVLRGR
ncbi:Putative glucose-methanol-choline oxidoreductase, FAD/NAD(P)-binding domain superfamily [Septoria linicola]|uniref:Glucose-methanol-choline oxidoreductase, FAD/NAD(P)-binding domain superfamily n=1 Tax=Septoria linicola TaxID=215465 RepID=A0A9Q9AVR4_9PEZI|nr:Putative glucose-methanol-choline oxidoreductase, FAD/NAD(P)-binding domain superfamily [Septoria linicola]